MAAYNTATPPEANRRGRLDKHILVSKQVDRLGQSATFWDGIAERYSKKPVADQTAYEKKLQVTREYFEPWMEVFEFGCGTGSTAIAHAPFVKHIRATDISSKMIEIARRKAEAANIDNVTFEVSTIEECAVPDQTVDAMLGLSILHLVEDRDAVIAKVHRMLKPGGLFVTSTPCLGDQMRFLLLRAVIPVGKLLGKLPSVTFFSTEQLQASLTRAGFALDYEWRPGKGKALFIVAKKAA